MHLLKDCSFVEYDLSILIDFSIPLIFDLAVVFKKNISNWTGKYWKIQTDLGLWLNWMLLREI